MIIKDPAEHPEPDQSDSSSQALLLDQETPQNALASAPPTHKALRCCLLDGQVHHWMWWLTKYFVDHVDIFHIYADMGNDRHTEMQLIFQGS